MEGGGERQQTHEQSHQHDAAPEEGKFLSFRFYESFEYEARRHCGQTASNGSHCPEEVDLRVGDAHLEGEVGLEGPQKSHGEALAGVGRPGQREVGEQPGSVGDDGGHLVESDLRWGNVISNI